MWVTAPVATCSAASGYKFTSANISAQVATVTPSGSLSDSSGHTVVSPSLTTLPASFFIPWQGAVAGQTPVQGYRGKVTYYFTGPTGPTHVTHFTTTIWWS